jgi:multidrug resistance efflux pump
MFVGAGQGFRPGTQEDFMKKLPRAIGALILLGSLILMISVAGLGRFGSRSRAEDVSPGAQQAENAPPWIVCFGHVDLEQGITSLYPAVMGRVVEVPVHETEGVHAGDVLLRLDDRLAQLRVREAEADLLAAKELLTQAEKLPDQHRAKMAQQRAAIEAVQHRLEGARYLLARKRELSELQHINRKEADAAGALVEEAEATLRAEQGKLRELEIVDPSSSAKRAQADVEAKEARLEQARRGVEECTLRAPADGTVLRVLVNPGEVLGPQPKQAALLFCPAGERIIRAEVEQEFAGRVAVGEAALIQDDTTTGPAWRGRVTRISDWYTQRRSILQEPFQFNDVRTLECLVALDPGQPPLRIGQRVRVTLGR